MTDHTDASEMRAWKRLDEHNELPATYGICIWSDDYEELLVDWVVHPNGWVDLKILDTRWDGGPDTSDRYLSWRIRPVVAPPHAVKMIEVTG